MIPVLFALVLFSELNNRSVAVAMPAGKLEATDQDGLDLSVSDEPMTEQALGYPRRSLILDNNIKDEDGNPKVIIISDMRLKGYSARGLNPAFTRSLSLPTDRNSGHNADYSLKIGRRDTDLDVLRCMIGRVYRPCWEV